MFIIKFSSHLVLLFSIFQEISCERRIVDGTVVTSEPSYTVYLVKAKDSIKTYDTWLCGGAIVTRWFIITSAACVEDVQFMYAIAGYRKYVNDKQIEEDECAKRMRKKIVYRCVPISYEFDYKNVEKWAYVDIALIKVESPYDFADATYQVICSYIPRPIPINFDEKRQATNTDAMMLGWGHRYSWREKDDNYNHNSDTLLFGSTTLYDKQLCAQEYDNYPELIKIIEKYMICTLNPGHVNDHGMPYSMGQNKFNNGGCITEEMKKQGMSGEVCTHENMEMHSEEDLINRRMRARDVRKRMNLTEISNNVTNYKDNGTDSVNTTNAVNGTDVANENSSISKADFQYNPGLGNVSGFVNGTFSRRSGICQNDHGGPLVTWVGKREVLIGVASVFKVSDDRRCIGPYLFTSTMCNGAFLGCVLGDRAFSLRTQNGSIRSGNAELCNSAPSVKGFDTIESYVSWKDHPDGPADNEKNMLRSRFKTNQNKNTKDDSDEPYVNILNRGNMPQVIIPETTPKTEEQIPHDRFSLNIAMPKIKPAARKRPLLRKRRPKITRPPSPKTSVQPDVEPSPIIRSPTDMYPRLITSLPVHIELSSTIRSSPQSLIRTPPNVENPSNIEYPQEMEPSPFLRPQMFRPNPIIKPSSIIRPPPIVRPLMKMGSPVFEETHNVKSEEDIVKTLFE